MGPYVFRVTKMTHSGGAMVFTSQLSLNYSETWPLADGINEVTLGLRVDPGWLFLVGFLLFFYFLDNVGIE
jgi:hypothetical protein